MQHMIDVIFHSIFFWYMSVQSSVLHEHYTCGTKEYYLAIVSACIRQDYSVFTDSN
jgi:O-glycosyl hydrolase